MLNLPLPPTTNNLFVNIGKGRAPSHAYKLWRQEAGWRLKAQKPRTVSGRVVILIGVERPNTAAGRASDVDNRVKALLDLLVKHKVIDDDKTVDGLAVAWNPPGKGEARVLITPAARMQLHYVPTLDGLHGSFCLDVEPLNNEGAT